MKKLLVLAVLASAIGMASATDIGVHGTHNPDSSADSVGVTLGQKFGAYGIEAGFDRSVRGTTTTSKYSVVGSYDVLSFHSLTIAPKIGAAFINPSNSGVNGYAATVGVGASYPLTSKVSIVADYAYQRGQDRVRDFNGNLFSAGVKYSF